MATIFPFVSEGAHDGQEAQLKTKAIIWLNVGSGVVEAISDYDIDIKSKVDLKFYKGNLNIHLTLLDQIDDATSGPARVQLNAHVDENGSYEVRKDTLAVSAMLGGKAQKISLSRYDHDNMTECKLEGSFGLTAYVSPQ